MSAQQYQNTVNRLDKEIADLEKKKATFDAKYASEMSKANIIKLSRNASESTIRSKTAEIERHTNEAVKASTESTKLAKKISDKREERRRAYLQLQSEEQKEQKKQTEQQKKQMADIKSSYEKRISQLQSGYRTLVSKQYVNHSHNDEDEDDYETDDTKQYDVFMSHAWEDKEDFVDEFVEELRSLGVKVWYDRTQIKWADSMRHRIDEGLKKSKYGIVVLSPNYIAEGKYWTKAEFNGLFQMESNNQSRLLPIWHNLTKKQVMDFSPLIADKLALTTARMTPKEIAEEFAKLFLNTEEE